ncbi:WD repeat-containing protein [Verticillium alfalfae VaMs.102]|uniref:Pre-rRNA-processing protein IPI3 n=1 Tax=Verticillium alfalfae (strain VaMs.102 / ATCC MYA-4576 / FGSC 10136) TaxID=526221 RepID=C9S9L7_VERA1|nr:WD repeat-containing protein [Verticillium alfalfae VaMs.102]EEY16080.1 WD repeat-containing protein [Verticillium alfalfae VaMs.102]
MGRGLGAARRSTPGTTLSRRVVVGAGGRPLVTGRVMKQTPRIGLDLISSPNTLRHIYSDQHIPVMLSEEFFSAVCGPPIAANTAISKDVGLHCHTLTPSYAVKSNYKKSAAPTNCLAISPSHVFAAQNEKSQIHVYSKARGTQEVTVTLGERIRSLALIGDVLAVGTVDGSLMLWEGRHHLARRQPERESRNQPLRLSHVPLCVALDPCSRAVLVSCEDGSLYLVELFGAKPLVGQHSAEVSSTAVQVTSPLGVADAECGPASCLAISHDGTTVLTGHTKGKILQWQLTDNGHPTELTDLNASVTNLVFPPLTQATQTTRPVTVIKPSLAERQYTFTAQLEADLAPPSRFQNMLNSAGFPDDVLEKAILSFTEPSATQSGNSAEAQKQIDELKEIIEGQKALHKATLQKLADAKSSK